MKGIAGHRESYIYRAGFLKATLSALIFLLCAATPARPQTELSQEDYSKSNVPERPNRDYVILVWNTLGMHCYNRDCQDFMILPPYNTLWAQIIKTGNPPQIVTEGVDVEYIFPANTYSANYPGSPDKTNFWYYCKALFNVNLKPNIGLAGKSLSGVMDKVGDHFEANGIPLTEYRDIDVKLNESPDKWNRYPYQTATITLRDSQTKAMLAQTITVAPVSSELNCVTCHADDGDATKTYPITPTGKVETNILAIHDYLNSNRYEKPLLSSRPVLCANCHSSNALGKSGQPGISSLSRAVHNRHKYLPDITPDTNGCYNCHPGAQTQCLRDTMSENFSFNCVTCHGTIEQVANNPDPWVTEPRCDNAACHGNSFAMDKPLYRQSQGHGRLYCAGCHDSPHAIAPSRESNDSVKFVYMTGQRGKSQDYKLPSLSAPSTNIRKALGLFGQGETLRDCTVCHTAKSGAPFKHGKPQEVF